MVYAKGWSPRNWSLCQLCSPLLSQWVLLCLSHSLLGAGLVLGATLGTSVHGSFGETLLGAFSTAALWIQTDVVLKTSALRHALLLNGFSGNLHFSGYVAKWCFRSENEMKTSLPPSCPPSSSEVLFRKQGFWFFKYLKHRHILLFTSSICCSFLCFYFPYFFFLRLESVPSQLSAPLVTCREQSVTRGLLKCVKSSFFFNFFFLVKCAQN